MWALLTLLELSSLFAAPPAKIPDRLQSAIKLSQHTIERDGAGFKAVNWNQNLDLRFDRSAVLVRLPDAEVRLRLAGYGGGSELAKPMPATLTASKNRLEYHRGTLTEWYVNDAWG